MKRHVRARPAPTTPVSPLTTNPGTVTARSSVPTSSPATRAGSIQSLRPMWPVSVPHRRHRRARATRRATGRRAGVPHTPTAVFGTWKAAVRSVDKTVSPNKITITPDADPDQEQLEPRYRRRSGAVRAGQRGIRRRGALGRAARVWSLLSHPGDGPRRQSDKGGGDSGEACVIYCAGGGGDEGGGGQGGAGGGPPPPMCPTGTSACGAGGINPSACPTGTACANGCCLTVIP